jgi:hypothetical protein
MAIVDGEYLIFKHFQQQAGQQILNVFAYEVTDAADAVPDSYYGAARGFYFLFANTIRTLQTTALQHLRTECTPLVGIEQGIFANPTPVLGSDVGQPLPTMNAASIQLVRTTRLTRHGWKRFGGLTEGGVTLNDLTAASLAILNDVITDVMNPTGVNFPQIDDGGNTIGSFVAVPVIVGDPVPPATTFRINLVSSCIPKSQVTTQNTRKVGRGS